MKPRQRQQQRRNQFDFAPKKSRSRLAESPKRDLGAIAALVPNNLPEFTVHFYQLTFHEKELLKARLEANIQNGAYNFDDIMTIIAHAKTTLISEWNIEITVKDKTGLQKSEDGRYILESFPMDLANHLLAIVNDDTNQTQLRTHIKSFCRQ